MEEQVKRERVTPKPNSRGVWIEMADAREYLVPFMPVGPKAKALLRMLSEFNDKREDIEKVKKDAEEAGLSEEEQGKEIAEKVNMEEVTEGQFELCVGIMQLNYTNMSPEDFEPVFDCVCAAEILEVFCGNRRA